MSQKIFQIFRSQISDLKTDNVDYLKKPPWKKFFFDIFAIHLTSRYEKRCQMLQRLFSLFQGSKNQLCALMVPASQTCRRLQCFSNTSNTDVNVPWGVDCSMGFNATRAQCSITWTTDYVFFQVYQTFWPIWKISKISSDVYKCKFGQFKPAMTLMHTAKTWNVWWRES